MKEAASALQEVREASLVNNMNKESGSFPWLSGSPSLAAVYLGSTSGLDSPGGGKQDCFHENHAVGAIMLIQDPEK